MVSVNDTFNRLTIADLFKEKSKWYASCKCSCGKEIQRIYVRSLLTGNTKSCGCYNSDLTKQRNLKHGAKNRNQSRNRLYEIWVDMRRRCNSTTHNRAKNYSLKGIRVCDEWNDFLVFQDWAIKNGYNDSLSIERIDNDKNYCPENCKWISMKDQAKNRTTNHYLTLNGKTQTLTDWAIETGINRTTITGRLRKGWSVERALTEPTNKY
jgi:hypothetical protein